MSEELRKNREVRLEELRLEDLVRFTLQPSQEYQGERLEELMNSIDRVGLMTPIIVRPADGGKYEIICGHNRVNASRALGKETILADVRENLDDDKALGLFYDSNLNQQSFSEWNYAQKIKAIQYAVPLIEKNSQQGKRNDLIEKEAQDGTSVQDGHKSEKKSRRETTRDRMARRLGIATSTLSKFKRIIKLPEPVIDGLAKLLDERRITFEAAFRMAAYGGENVEKLIDLLTDSQNADKKVDQTKLKELCARKKITGKDAPLPVLTKADLKDILVSKNPE